MHKAASQNGVDGEHSTGLSFFFRAPVGSNVRTDPHSVKDSDAGSDRTATSKNERTFAGAAANRHKAASQGLSTRQTRVLANSLGRAGKEKVQFEVIVTVGL